MCKCVFWLAGWLSICLSVCLSLCLCLCLSLSLSLCLSLSLSPRTHACTNTCSPSEGCCACFFHSSLSIIRRNASWAGAFWSPVSSSRLSMFWFLPPSKQESKQESNQVNTNKQASTWVDVCSFSSLFLLLVFFPPNTPRFPVWAPLPTFGKLGRRGIPCRNNRPPFQKHLECLACNFPRQRDRQKRKVRWTKARRKRRRKKKNRKSCACSLARPHHLSFTLQPHSNQRLEEQHLLIVSTLAFASF